MSSGKRFSAVRLVQALIKAGVSPHRLRVTYDRENNKIIVEVVAEASQSASTATDLDDWLAKHADSTQGH
jgi:hypothetical protein